MKKITLQCKLLSDVVLNATGASEGRLPSLDFIPGSNFLGIVAKKYSNAMQQNIAMDLFHNGDVRFGDAHILLNEKRSLKVPAAWFYEKGKTLQDGIHLHNKMNRDDHAKLTEKGKQLKQARQGYFIEEGDKLVQISSDKAKYYAMKSAYDSDRRRAKDEKLFGYTALRRDTCWQFTVTFTESGNKENIVKFVRDNLSGEHNIGLSRSAQYGRVKIDIIAEKNINRSATEKVSGRIILYAESRLAFLDAHGLPTIRPEPEMIGLSTGSILWEKSQILTSRYSPWNGKRRANDADRICIDKGSVIVVDVKNTDVTFIKSGVGYYKNDGFGEVRINPEFLLASDEKGKLTIELSSSGDIFSTDKDETEQPLSYGSLSLVNWLQKKKQFHGDNQLILQLVNDFTDQHSSKFDEKFASQWGMIRSIAEQTSSYEELMNELFLVNTTNRNESGFLEHGVTMNKWQKNGRKTALKDFLENTSINDNIKVRLTIKLASEMAKNTSGVAEEVQA